MKFICSYDNGYESDYEKVFIEASCYDKAEAYMAEGLYDYAESHVLGVEGFDLDEGFESDEAESDYYDNCEYYVGTATDAEFYAALEEEGDGEDAIIHL